MVVVVVCGVCAWGGGLKHLTSLYTVVITLLTYTISITGLSASYNLQVYYSSGCGESLLLFEVPL